MTIEMYEPPKFYPLQTNRYLYNGRRPDRAFRAATYYYVSVYVWAGRWLYIRKMFPRRKANNNRLGGRTAD